MQESHRNNITSIEVFFNWEFCLIQKVLPWFGIGKLYSSRKNKKAMAPHSSTLAWKIPWTEEPGRLQSMGLLSVGHDWVTSLSLFTFMHWRRRWQPTPVFLPGESQGRGSLVGCRLWGRTESDWSDLAAAAGERREPEAEFSQQCHWLKHSCLHKTSTENFQQLGLEKFQVDRHRNAGRVVSPERWCKLCALAPYPAQCVSSIWLFLNIFYDNLQ